MADIAWPIDSRELHTQLYHSTAWNDFGLRAEDIVISTWAKSGTTWTQQIVAQLLFDGAEDTGGGWECSPWLDLRVTPSEVKLHGSGSTKLTGASSRHIFRWMLWSARSGGS